MDTSVEDVPPIVFVSDDCCATDQSFNDAGTKLNVENDVSTSYFPPSKRFKCFSTIDYDDNSVSFIHPSTSSTADVLCLMTTYPWGTLSCLPIMQQTLARSRSIIMDQR